MDNGGLTASPDPSLDLRMVFEILTNSAWPGGTTGVGATLGVRAVAPGMEQVGRVAALQGGWGVLQLGLPPSVRHPGSSQVWLYFPHLHFQDPAPAVPPLPGCWGPRGSATGFGGGRP